MSHITYGLWCDDPDYFGKKKKCEKQVRTTLRERGFAEDFRQTFEFKNEIGRAMIAVIVFFNMGGLAP